MIDITIIKKVLEENLKNIVKSIDSDVFISKYQPSWDFIKDYLKKYNILPDIQTIVFENNIQIPDYETINIVEPIDYYLEKLENRRIAQKLEVLKETIKEKINKNPTNLLLEIRNTTKEISLGSITKKNDVINWASEENAAKRLEDYFRKKNNETKGILTPWITINRLCNGIEKSKFWMITAKLKSGKTWNLFSAIGMEAWKQGYNVLAISPEIDTTELGGRLDSAFFRLNYGKFRKSELSSFQEEKYIDGIEDFKDRASYNINMDGNVKTFSDVEILAEKFPTDIILIDSFYMLKPSSGYHRSTHDEMEAVCQEIIHFKKTTGISVVCAHQFNRDVDGENISGGSSNIAKAYAISQYCDLMLGLYRNQELTNKGQMVIRILESRYCEKANLLCRFNLDDMLFDEIGTFEGDDINNIEYTSGEVEDVIL